MDLLNKLSKGEQIIGGAGIVLFIVSFFPWFGVEVGIQGFGTLASYSENAWGSVFSLLGVLVALAVVVWLVLDKLTTVTLPKLPLPQGQAYLVGTGVAAALILLQFVIGSGNLDRKWGSFLGVLVAIGFVAGGYLRSTEPETTTAPPTSF